MKILIFSCLCTFIMAGCSKPTDASVSEIPGSTTPSWSYEGTVSFSLNGVQRAIGVFAQSNGYVPGEVVIRGSGEGMENTLMLTFKPNVGRVQSINRSMTGYWDLGLCIPFNKYVLMSDTLNSIRVTSSDSTLTGQFDLIFRYEKDTTRTATFLHGTFTVKADTVYPFKYCIEG